MPSLASKVVSAAGRRIATAARGTARDTIRTVAASGSPTASLVSSLIPSGTLSTDSDGVRRYTLSDDEVRKLRNLLGGVLKDDGGKPSFRVARVDEAVVPAVLARFGLPVGLGVAAVFMLGRWSVK